MNGFPLDFLPMDTFANWTVRATLAAGWLALIVGVVCLLAGRWIGPRQRAVLWLIVVIRLALPAAPEFAGSLHFSFWKTSENSTALAVRVAPADENVLVPDANVQPYSEIAAPQAPAMNAEEMLVAALSIAWILGTVIAAAMILWSNIYWWLRLRPLSPTDEPRLLMLLERCRDAIPLRRSAKIVVVPGLQIPAVTGVFRPRILLPEDVAHGFTDVEIEHILLHELAHVKRNDLGVNHLLSFLQVLHWWNPVYWFVRRQLVKERELACDEVVLRVLGGGEATRYGRTLVRIVERLTDAAERLWHPVIGGAGLISLLGRRSALETRLRRLPTAARARSRTVRILAWSLVALAAVAGLTDAEQPATNASAEPSSFMMPEGARFHTDSGENLEPSGKLLVICYQMKDLLERIEKEQGLSRKGAQEFLKMSAPISERVDDGNLKTPTAGDNDNYILNPKWISTLDAPYDLSTPQPANGAASRPNCAWQEDLMILRASQKSHENFRNLLEIWRQHGLPQISIEVRFIDSSIDLVQSVGITGGEIYTAIGRNEQPRFNASESDAVAEMRGRSETMTTAPMPLYMKHLNPEDARKFIEFCQGQVRTNMLFAPKITIFAGQDAQISDEVRRPFVVGLRSVAEAVRDDQTSADKNAPDDKAAPRSAPASTASSLEPQVVVVPEGFSTRITAYQHSPSKLVHLNWEIVESRIADVTVGTVGQGSGKPPLSVQIPSVKRRICTASANINSGESLLIHALESNSPNRRRTYMLITPRVLDEPPAK